MNTEKINLREVRDFGETFNASIKFLRQNFKSFFQAVLFIAGPFILLSAIAGAFYQGQAMTVYSPANLLSSPSQDPVEIMLRQFGIWYLVFILAASIAHIMLSSTVYAYMIVYQEKGPRNFTVNDVASYVWRKIANVIITYLVILLLTVIIVGALVGIIFACAMAAPALAVLVGFFMIIGMLIIVPPLMWQLSAMYLAVMQPDETFLGGFVKPGRVMRGNFWWTWIIVVCASIGIGLMGMVFTLPQAGYQMVVMMTSRGEAPIGFLIVATICTFMATLLYGLMHIIFGVHYYSLAEQKDGKGMMERINEIGSIRPPDVNQQY